jgi:hypothetical protein
MNDRLLGHDYNGSDYGQTTKNPQMSSAWSMTEVVAAEVTIDTRKVEMKKAILQEK